MSAKIALSFEEMMSFLGGKADSRNIIEGERVLNAGLVIVVGSRGKSNNVISIFALVLQTSGISKEPLQIFGELILEEMNAKVVNMTCSCKAGMSAKCKHIGAVLWYLNRNDINELEELLATDVRCYWSRNRQNAVSIDYAPRKIKDFCCVKDAKLPARPVMSREDIQKAHEILMKASPGCALALHRAGRLRKTVRNMEEE